MTEDLHHLAAAYALDALDEAERRAFEAHYPTCSICSAEVIDYRETAALLAESTEQAPPDSVKAGVMAEIARTRQIAPQLPERVVDLAEQKRRRQPRQRVLAAVAAAIVAVVGFGLGMTIGRGADEPDAVLVASDAVTVPLEGDAGVARVVWSAAEGRAVLIADGLAEPDDGLAYELWLIDDSGATPTGLFEPGDDGSVTVEVSLDGRTPQAWGITLEPDTGSDQPTEPILLIGTA